MQMGATKHEATSGPDKRVAVVSQIFLELSWICRDNRGACDILQLLFQWAKVRRTESSVAVIKLKAAHTSSDRNTAVELIPKRLSLRDGAPSSRKGATQIGQRALMPLAQSKKCPGPKGGVGVGPVGPAFA